MDDNPLSTIITISASAPARPLSTDPSDYNQSLSPFRFVRYSVDDRRNDEDENEKYPPPTRDPLTSTRSLTPSPFSCRPSSSSSSSSSFPPPLIPRPHFRSAIATRMRPWLPLIFYAISSLGFLVAIAFWRDQLFAVLDQLSHWLQVDYQFGYAVLFSLIFLTTFPPIPLYSTLIILSGYTFGPWTGAIISYFAALTGAIVVFTLSRAFLRDTISRWLSCAVSIKRVVRAIERRPHLLFLIRLAPYPYNVMNCLLAASPTLTFRTYTICTALSLFKVIVHTMVGASMHSFKDYHAAQDDGASMVARTWTITGIVLCIGLLVYLTLVARRAVDSELEDEEGDSEERIGFLSGSEEAMMTEIPSVRRASLVPAER